ADEELCGDARARWHDTRVFGRFFQSTLEEFRRLYGRELPDSAVAERKRALFREAARRWDREVRPELRAGRYGDLDPEGLNNAWLLGRVLYYRRLDDFEAVYRRSEGLREAVHRVMDAVRQGREGPWAALDRLLDEGADGG
ncbi:MAG: aminopeptidase, partial [Gemmatimonadota bacterium]